MLTWQSATGRTYQIQATADLAAGFTNVVAAAIPAGASASAVTVDVSSIAGPAYYRIVVESP